MERERQAPLAQKPEVQKTIPLKQAQYRLSETGNTYHTLLRNRPSESYDDAVTVFERLERWTNYYTKIFSTLKRGSDINQLVESSFDLNLISLVHQAAFKNSRLSLPEQERLLYFYNIRFGDISLADIENLQLPFTIEEFKKVSDFISAIAIESQDEDNSAFRRVSVPFMGLASNQTPPKNLAPLINRLKAYFDFYKRVIIDYQVDEVEEELFLAYFKNWPKDNLDPFQTNLSYFKYAGLLPFSIFQIMHTRKNQSLDKEGWENIIQLFMRAQDQSVEQVNLNKGQVVTKSMVERILFDQEKDQKVAQFLFSNLGKKDISVFDFAKLIINNQQITERIDKHQVKKQDFIFGYESIYQFQTQEKTLPIKNIEFDFIRSQHVVAEIEFEGLEDKLMVQITPEGEVYGMPVALVDYPAYSESIKNTILKVYLEFLDSKQQEREKQQQAELEKKSKEPRQQEVDLPKIPVVINYAGRKPKKQNLISSRKRKRQRQQQFSKSEEFKSITVQQSSSDQEKKIRRAFYSRDSITQLLGRRTNDDDVSRVMRGMKSFEVGLGDVKKNRGKVYGHDVYQMRIGRSRLLLRKEDEVFVPFYIGRRQDTGGRYVQ